ncbi:MAG: hypothetical protein CMM50_18920 [Rhodospirillaceae bacterium]|nr:hypothetical protein [Rhodospirillaceae bacterium]
MLKKTRFLIGGGAVASVLTAAAIVWAAPVAGQAEGPAVATPMVLAHGGWDHNGEDRGMYRGDRRGGDSRHERWGRSRHEKRSHGFGAFCGRDMGPMTAFVTSMVEHRIDMNDAQTAAWGEVKTALATAGGTMAAACDKLKADNPASDDTEAAKMTLPTTPERLTRFETLLSAGLEAVQTVTPTVDRFYATLDQDQQKTFDSLLSRGRHGRKG